MDSVTLLNVYFTAQLLLVLAAAAVAGMRILSSQLRQPLAYRHQLRVGYALTAAALVLPWIAALPIQIEVFAPTAQIWSGESMRATTAADGQQLALATVTQASVPLHAARTVLLMLLLGSALPFLGLLGRDVQRMRQLMAGAQCIARQGTARVLVSAAVHVPFSFWLPRRHVIVLPAELLPRRDDLRIALRHEAQHHRQLDTKLIYVYQLLRAVFLLNPAMHWLHRSIVELQEFACDEALLVQRKVAPVAYCGCLLRVAEHAVDRQRLATCASMLGSTLQNRILAVVQRPARLPARPARALALGLALLVAMGGVAWAASGTVQDRRISMEQATAMAVQARAGSDFPIVVNPRVLEQLNRLLGTPDGRAFIRESLQRMQQHEALIAQKTAQYGLPAELLAVPLAESGFRNLPPSANPRHGAGLWMFIAPTARSFGLQVNGSIDERLNVTAETDAAMRMFAGLHQNFADWGLALLAYNAGSRRVQQAIDATGSRDVWQFIDQGYENDPDYVARVMAAVLIIRNPQVAE